MIKEINSIEIVSGEFSPLLPRIFMALKYKSGRDNVWKQVDENGKTTALLSSVDNNFTLITTEKTDFEEITEEIKDIQDEIKECREEIKDIKINNIVLAAKTQINNSNFDILVKKNLDDGVNYPTALNNALKTLIDFEIKDDSEEIIVSNSNLKLTLENQIAMLKASMVEKKRCEQNFTTIIDTIFRLQHIVFKVLYK